MGRQMGNCQKINCQSTHRISTIFWLQQQPATYMKKRLISLYMESKEDFFLAKSVWFSYLKHVCVCVHMRVSVCCMVMFNLLESHNNTLSPVSSKNNFRTACYRFQEPQVQVVQTMVVNQLCLSNPLTSSETYDIGAVSWRFCARNRLIGF